MAAPRRANRLWRGLARGAWLAAALVAMSAGAQGQPTADCEPVFLDAWQFCSATYAGPTTRYAHGVLGDAIEWESLEVRFAMAGQPTRVLRLTLDESHVFEDLTPRPAALFFSSQPQIITIRSHYQFGAQLAIYLPDPESETLELIATTPYIGRRNRWLAPVGVADFNGDGLMDIAYVDRPHLARTLRVWTFEDGALREIASAGGFSNHRIGEDFITGGVRDCGAGPEMVLADAIWSSVMIARMVEGVIEAEPVARFSPEAIEGALDCR